MVLANRSVLLPKLCLHLRSFNQNLEQTKFERNYDPIVTPGRGDNHTLRTEFWPVVDSVEQIPFWQQTPVAVGIFRLYTRFQISSQMGDAHSAPLWVLTTSSDPETPCSESLQICCDVVSISSICLNYS